MTTFRQYKTAAIAAYRTHVAVELTDTRLGARMIWRTQAEDLGRRIIRGTATAQAISAAKKRLGYIPCVVNISLHEIVDVEDLWESEQGKERPSHPGGRERLLLLEHLDRKDRIELFRRRSFQFSFNPGRLP